MIVRVNGSDLHVFVVGEAVIAYEMANAMVEKFGGDSLEEMKRNYDSYQTYVKSF